MQVGDAGAHESRAHSDSEPSGLNRRETAAADDGEVSVHGERLRESQRRQIRQPRFAANDEIALRKEHTP